MIEEAHVLAARALGGTRWAAEDTGARHAENERAVEGAVAIEDGLPAAGVDPFVDLAVNLADDWFRGSGWGCFHCFLWEYLIGGHGGKIGPSGRTDYPNLAVKRIFARTGGGG